MRVTLFWFCLCKSSLSWALVEAAKAKKTDVSSNPSNGRFDNDDDATSDILIEENPDYVALENFSLDKGDDLDCNDSYDYDDDSDGGSSDDDDDDDAKSKISKKLKKVKNNPFKLLKKNRYRITIALAVFAFRKEIIMVLLKLFGLRNPKSITTDVLKLLLFVDFMRRMQSGGLYSLGGGNDSSVLNTVGAMIDKTMNSNPAYVPPVTQHFAFESLNEYYLKDGMALQKALRSRHVGLTWPSSSTSSIVSRFTSSKIDSSSKKTTSANDQTLVVLDWTKLDQQLTSMNQLRQQIAFLLSEYRSLVMEGEQAANVTMGKDSKISPTATASATATATATPIPNLEVVVLLESPGGSVSEYGLAGQYLLRLRNTPGITLTICVDKVAASGGYLLCCTASPGKLFAAPFALLGSIGVIATQINVNKLLTNWGIQPLEFRGGKYKAPIGMLGRVSKDGKRVTQTMIDDIHRAFKQHIVISRPVLKDKIEKIGDGSVWLGVDALDLNLVDSIKTSDEYIEEKIRDGTRVFKMVQAPRPSFLFGPRVGSFDMVESKRFSTKDPSTTTQEDIEGFIQKSKAMMLRLPTHAKSLLS